MKTDPPSDWDDVTETEVTAVESPHPLHEGAGPKKRSSDTWRAATPEEIERALKEHFQG